MDTPHANPTPEHPEQTFKHGVMMQIQDFQDVHNSHCVFDQ